MTTLNIQRKRIPKKADRRDGHTNFVVPFKSIRTSHSQPTKLKIATIPETTDFGMSDDGDALVPGSGER
jgi:hypothetical protein